MVIAIDIRMLKYAHIYIYGYMYTNVSDPAFFSFFFFHRNLQDLTLQTTWMPLCWYE